MSLKYVILTLSLLLYGCYPQHNESMFLYKANEAVEKDYKIVKDYLDMIDNPNFLDEADFALYTYLSCRIADSQKIALPLHADIERATNWYADHKDDLITARMLLYLGRSLQYNQHNYQAMNAFLKALSLSKEKKFDNEAGYISSYIGDLYNENGDMFAALKKYDEAANYFLKSGNKRSRAYAFRDMGRTWALVDSFSLAMNAFSEAEKLAIDLKNKRIQSSILNGKGNVYSMIGELDLAEEALLASLDLDSLEAIPTINALTDLYIGQQLYKKAHHYLDSLSAMNISDDYRNTLNYIYYLLFSSQDNFEDALSYLEKVFEYDQFHMVDDSKISFHELEKRYNNILLITQIDKLKIKIQYFVIGVTILLLLFLSVIIVAQYRTIKSNKLISKQEKDISNQDKEIQSLMTKFYHLNNELSEKEKIINATQRENDEKYQQKEAEVELLNRNIKDLSKNIKELRRNRLLNSDIGKKLKSLASSVKPKTDTPLITSRMWKQIEKEVKEVYPEFELKIFDMNQNELLESEWFYCCLCLFNFDGNEEGILLNINPQSALTRRSRIRKKLGIDLDAKGSLYDYFTEKMLMH